MLELDVGSQPLRLYLAEGLVPEFVASISRQNFFSNPDNVAVGKLNLTAAPDAFSEEGSKELASGIGEGAFLTLILSCLNSIV